MNNYPEASIAQNGIIKTVVCQEKGRKFILTNKSGKDIIKVHVADGGTVFLVELKGKDKEHAFEQLYNTLDYFRKNFATEKYHCRVVLSKGSSPKTAGKFEKLLMKARKEKRCIDYDSACVIYDKDVV